MSNNEGPYNPTPLVYLPGTDILVGVGGDPPPDVVRVVHLREEAPRILGRAPKAWAMLTAPVPSYRIEAIHRDLLAMGRDVTVNVNEVPVRATATEEGDEQ